METGLRRFPGPGQTVAEDRYPAVAEWTTEEDWQFSGVLLVPAGAGGWVGLVANAGSLNSAIRADEAPEPETMPWYSSRFSRFPFGLGPGGGSLHQSFRCLRVVTDYRLQWADGNCKTPSTPDSHCDRTKNHYVLLGLIILTPPRFSSVLNCCLSWTRSDCRSS